MSHVEAWNSAFLSIFERGISPPVELRQGNWAFSRGATGESEIILCCEGIRVLPFDWCWEISFNLEMNGTRCRFDLCQEAWGSSRVSIYETGLLVRCKEKVQFLSSQNRIIGHHHEMM